MNNRLSIALIATALCLGTAFARADILISLSARNVADEQITGPVTAGTVLFVDVFLAADEDDDPVPDIRQVRLDTSNSADTLEIFAITWTIAEGAYPLQTISENLFSAASLAQNAPQDALSLMQLPVQVATLEVTVNGSGTIDAQGPLSLVNNFDLTRQFTADLGNLIGTPLEIRVLGEGTEGDADGDGVLDVTDAFPSDPLESRDNDEDGVGDNADADDDNDGVIDDEDAFPTDPEEQADTDSDGVGDNADAFPEDSGETIDTDGDGVGDNGDAFPLDSNRSDLTADDFNTGPLVTGGLCGAVGLLPVLMAILIPLAGHGRGAPRRSR